MKISFIKKNIFLLTVCYYGIIFADIQPILNETSESDHKVKLYNGIARDNSDKILYTERHEALFDSKGKIQQTKTEYFDSDGNKIGEMNSNYTLNLTAPSYEYIDFRLKSNHGVRFENDGYLLFSRDDGEAEKTKFFKSSLFRNSLVVGCQGLHYYLQENLDFVREKKQIPIAFLIPGNLDYYNFRLVFVDENDKTVKLKIEIKNIFLRLFAPSLDLEYDKVTKRLINYSGLSHIKSEKGDPLNVKIIYNYDGLADK